MFFFSAYLFQFWLKIMPERGFLIFWFLLMFFFWIFLLGSSLNGIRDINFFFSLSTYLLSFWLKIMTERGFLIFLIFLLFFRNFPAWVDYERNLGLKFFSLSRPISARFVKNYTGKRFFNFLLFFSEFSCPSRVWTEFGTKILVSLSWTISSPFGKK